MKKNILKRTAVCALASIMLVGTVSGCSTKGNNAKKTSKNCLLYTSPSPRDT